MDTEPMLRSGRYDISRKFLEELQHWLRYLEYYCELKMGATGTDLLGPQGR
jgi:hypothetical protein